MARLDLKKACNAILDDKIIILPTETVYGLACLPRNQDKLHQLKGRKYQPVAFIYPSVKHFLVKHVLDEYLIMITQRLLPGPFTLLFDNKQKILSQDDKIGIRIPEHDLCLEFLTELGQEIIMTSANLHGAKPATSFEEAQAIFPELDGIDGGICKYSRPSAIIDLSKVLR